MKKIFSTIAILLSGISCAMAQVTVFQSGEEGYKIYRIPAIIKTPQDHLLAFCEGRVNSGGDFGDIDIVMKRSTDQGKTWSAVQVVADNKDLQAGNPAPVVDLTDPAYPGGRIFLFYNTGNDHESAVRKGQGQRKAWYKTSVDGGKTWTAPVDITQQVHKVNEGWRCLFNTPGHAAQFTEGKYKGRIYIASNHSAGDPQPQFQEYRAHGYYTDDHGKTFRLSEDVHFPGGNEATATPLSNGRLMMNIRNQRGNVKARIVALSNDGGQRWDTAYFDHQLPDAICQGSILPLGKSLIAFSNAADTAKRDNLTLRISANEGKTWKREYVIDKTGVAGNAAYSDIVALKKKNTIGVLYEKDKYARIIFTVVPWKK